MPSNITLKNRDRRRNVTLGQIEQPKRQAAKENGHSRSWANPIRLLKNTPLGEELKSGI
jgi:hypothetical protein